MAHWDMGRGPLGVSWTPDLLGAVGFEWVRLVLADPVGALSNYDLKSLDAVGQNIIHISDRNEGFFVQNCSVIKKKISVIYLILFGWSVFSLCFLSERLINGWFRVIWIYLFFFFLLNQHLNTLNFIWICFAFWLLPSLWYSLINWQSYILSPFFGLTKGNIVKTIISTFVQVVYKAKAAL